MAARVAHACFEKYHRARLEFVSDVADMASKPHYLESLLDEGAVIQLKRLLHDKVPSVQQTAALALGRLASYSTELATELVASHVLQELTDSMRDGANIYHRRAGAFVIRAVAKHSPELAGACYEAGACEVLTECLQAADAGVRENAAHTLSVLASHTPELSSAVVAAGALPLLVVCMREPEPTLKRSAIAAITEIVKHSTELADAVADAGALFQLTTLLAHDDGKVRRHACAALAQVAKHTPAIAELVIEAGAFPTLLTCLQDTDLPVRRNAAVAVREIVKHSQELAALVVRSHGIGYLVDFLTSTHGNTRLAAVMALGFIASFSETLAMAVLKGGATTGLKDCVINEPEDHLKAAAVWALGQAGRHGSEHASLLAEHDVLRHLLSCMLHEEASEDLKNKSKRALRAILQHCTHLAAMQPLLPLAPPPVLRSMLQQFARVVPDDPNQRRQLVSGGGLKVILALDRADPVVAELVDQICDNYPPEVVEYCAPDFHKTLAERIARGDARGPGGRKGGSGGGGGMGRGGGGGGGRDYDAKADDFDGPDAAPSDRGDLEGGEFEDDER